MEENIITSETEISKEKTRGDGSKQIAGAIIIAGIIIAGAILLPGLQNRVLDIW